jgi:hypothetical protein
MYAVGVYDFIMIHSGNAEEYILRNFAPSSVAYLANYPLLPLAFWVLNLAAGIAAPYCCCYVKKSQYGLPSLRG